MSHLSALARVLPLAAVLALLTLAAASNGTQSDEAMMMASDQEDESLDPKALAFFESKIRPVLVDHCYSCHSADAKRLRGDFALDTRDSIRRGGPSGPGIVPGDPEASFVITALRYEDDFEMPPKGCSLRTSSRTSSGGCAMVPSIRAA